MPRWILKGRGVLLQGLLAAAAFTKDSGSQPDNKQGRTGGLRDSLGGKIQPIHNDRSLHLCGSAADPHRRRLSCVSGNVRSIEITFQRAYRNLLGVNCKLKFTFREKLKRLGI